MEYMYTQLYMTMEIREWMNQNMLKLNDDKPELIVFTSKYGNRIYIMLWA